MLSQATIAKLNEVIARTSKAKLPELDERDTGLLHFTLAEFEANIDKFEQISWKEDQPFRYCLNLPLGAGFNPNNLPLVAAHLQSMIASFCADPSKVQTALIRSGVGGASLGVYVGHVFFSL